MAWNRTPEVYDFDKQLVLENKRIEIEKKYWWLIKTFILSTTKDSKDWIGFKEWLLTKVKDDKNLQTPEERSLLTDYLEKLMLENTWEDRMQVMEIWARVGNIWKNIEWFTRIPENQEEIPFEIAWWTITKKVITRDKWWKWYELTTENKTYQITWWDIEKIWNNTYRVYLEWSRKAWKYSRIWTTEYIDIRYAWWNTLQIINNDWESIWIVPIRNKKEISVGRDFWRRTITEKNSFISFELKDSWVKIELELSFPNR